MRAAGPFLAALVARLLAATEHGRVPETFDGYELIAVDGTAFSGRCATGTDARIHAAIRLSDVAVVGATAFGFEHGETYKHFQWKKGQLAIGDRGYCNAPGIAWVVDHGGDVLVRLNRGAVVLVDLEDKPVDPFEWVRAISVGQIVEQAVRITATVDRKKRVIEGRLVATKLPEDKAEEARQRARDEQGSKVTKATLEMAAYVVVFTTSTLTAERCIGVYRLRWQVELLFKRWKSLCHFDRLPNERPDTILSWVTAKLLLGLLVDRLAANIDEDVFPSATRSAVNAAA
ncbi:MAG: transposase [Polyangiales bacterium]